MDKSDNKVGFPSEKASSPLTSIKGKVLSLLGGDKRKLVITVALLFGVLLVLLSLPSDDKTNSSDAGTLEEYKAQLESELSELCSSVEGAGKCKVRVSFSEGERSEYRGTNKISEAPPKVLGITVIAEGGGKSEVKAALTECMTALFDIGSNRVAVLKMR